MIIEMLHPYRWIAIVVLVAVLCIRRIIKAWVRQVEQRMARLHAAFADAEKPKRKRISPYDAYAQRLEEIADEAAYQRELAHEEYVDALKSTAFPPDVVSGGTWVESDDDTDCDVYTPIYGLRED